LKCDCKNEMGGEKGEEDCAEKFVLLWCSFDTFLNYLFTIFIFHRQGIYSQYPNASVIFFSLSPSHFHFLSFHLKIRYNTLYSTRITLHIHTPSLTLSHLPLSHTPPHFPRSHSHTPRKLLHSHALTLSLPYSRLTFGSGRRWK
jgi:hypothetical protein